MAWDITIGSHNALSEICRGTLSIGRELNSRATCSFRLMSKTGTYTPAVGAPVNIYHDNARLYGGFIWSVDTKRYKGSVLLEHSVTCVDASFVADRRTCYEHAWLNATGGQIVTDIVANSLNGEGVTYTYVSAGPTIAGEFGMYGYPTVSEAIQKVCDQTQSYWYIDGDMNVRYFSQTSLGYDAPFDITTDNAMEANLFTSLEEYANRVIINLSKFLLAEDTETFVGDGATTYFQLQHPVASEPVVKVDNVEKTVGISGSDTGKDWYWSQESATIAQDSGAAPLTGGQTLAVTYVGIDSAYASAQNASQISARAAIEGGTGVHTKVIQWTEAANRSKADAVAAAELDRIDELPAVVTYRTNDVNCPDLDLLKPGDKQTIFGTEYVLRSIKWEDDPHGNVLWAQIEGVRGPLLATLVDLLRGTEPGGAGYSPTVPAVGESGDYTPPAAPNPPTSVSLSIASVGEDEYYAVISWLPPSPSGGTVKFLVYLAFYEHGTNTEIHSVTFETFDQHRITTFPAPKSVDPVDCDAHAYGVNSAGEISASSAFSTPRQVIPAKGSYSDPPAATGISLAVTAFDKDGLPYFYISGTVNPAAVVGTGKGYAIQVRTYTNAAGGDAYKDCDWMTFTETAAETSPFTYLSDDWKQSDSARWVQVRVAAINGWNEYGAWTYSGVESIGASQGADLAKSRKSSLGAGLTKDANGKPASLTSSAGLQNGDFEYDLDGWDILGSPADVFVYTADKYSGTKCCRINAHSSAWCGLSQNLPFKYGQSARLTCWYKGNLDGYTVSVLRFLDKNLAIVGTQSLPSATMDGTWHKVDVAATAPADTAYIQIYPLSTNSANGYAIVDLVSLTIVDVDMTYAANFNTSEFEVVTSTFRTKVIAADKIYVGSVLRVGGGTGAYLATFNGASDGQIACYSAANALTAWMGKNGSYTGIWGGEAWIGGTSPANAQLTATGGTLAANGMTFVLSKSVTISGARTIRTTINPAAQNGLYCGLQVEDVTPSGSYAGEGVFVQPYNVYLKRPTGGSGAESLLGQGTLQLGYSTTLGVNLQGSAAGAGVLALDPGAATTASSSYISIHGDVVLRSRRSAITHIAGTYPSDDYMTGTAGASYTSTEQDMLAFLYGTGAAPGGHPYQYGGWLHRATAALNDHSARIASILSALESHGLIET